MNILERIKRLFFVPPKPFTIEWIRWKASLVWEDEEEEK